MADLVKSKENLAWHFLGFFFFFALALQIWTENCHHALSGFELGSFFIWHWALKIPSPTRPLSLYMLPLRKSLEERCCLFSTAIFLTQRAWFWYCPRLHWIFLEIFKWKFQNQVDESLHTYWKYHKKFFKILNIGLPHDLTPHFWT